MDDKEIRLSLIKALLPTLSIAGMKDPDSVITTANKYMQFILDEQPKIRKPSKPKAKDKPKNKAPSPARA